MKNAGAADAAHVAGLRAADAALRNRCAQLVDVAPTDMEWAEAALLECGGQDVSDEVLIAYWAMHRQSVTMDIEFPPDLADAMAAVAAGVDPVTYWSSQWNDRDEE